jgi:NADH dehydrogenase FAD-containing subunit
VNARTSQETVVMAVATTRTAQAPWHRVVVLGAGYAGLGAAQRMGRELSGQGVEVTLVNDEPVFVERPRLHQVATGQAVPALGLEELLEGTGAKLTLGTVSGIDLDEHEVLLAGGARLGYDTLVYALGSRTDTGRVPGVAEHAAVLSGRDAAHRLAGRAAAAAAAGGTLVVVGGGLTGIEAASEFAETFPRLHVRLVSRSEAGNWLSPGARAHLADVFTRLGVEVTTGAAVTEVRRGELVLDDGRTAAFDLCLWAGGFTVPTLAAEAGLAVNTRGRVLVGSDLRSVSHPDVLVLGDAAAVAGRWGEELNYGCRTGAMTMIKGPAVVAASLAGRPTGPFRFGYFNQCISLGREDGIIQYMKFDAERPRRAWLRGRAAARYKEFVLWGALLNYRRPGPYLPRRRTGVGPGRALVPATGGRR